MQDVPRPSCAPDGSLGCVEHRELYHRLNLVDVRLRGIVGNDASVATVTLNIFDLDISSRQYACGLRERRGRECGERGEDAWCAKNSNKKARRGRTYLGTAISCPPKNRDFIAIISFAVSFPLRALYVSCLRSTAVFFRQSPLNARHFLPNFSLELQPRTTPMSKTHPKTPLHPSPLKNQGFAGLQAPSSKL